jgi:hypothetical protein
MVGVDRGSPDEVLSPKCLKGLSTALDSLTNQAIIACKLLREENRLLRKERKLMMLESNKTKNVSQGNEVIREMNEQFLLKTMELKSQAADLAKKNMELQG